MPDSLLVTKVNLPILRRIFAPLEKILRPLSTGVRGGSLLMMVFAPAWYKIWLPCAGGSKSRNL